MMGKIVANICVKFNYDRFHIDKAGNFKNLITIRIIKRRTFVALEDQFRVQNSASRCVN